MLIDGFNVTDNIDSYECARCGEYSICTVGCWIFRYTFIVSLCNTCCNRVYSLIPRDQLESKIEGPVEFI